MLRLLRGVPSACTAGCSAGIHSDINLQSLYVALDPPPPLQWVMGVIQASVLVPLLSILAIVIVKEAFADSAHLVVLNRTFSGIVAASFSALLIVFTAMQARVLWRVRQSLRLGRTWSRRRVIAARGVVAHAVNVSALLLVAAGGSATYLHRPKLFCFPKWPSFAAQYVASLVWNFQLLLFAVAGHNVMLIDKHDTLSERTIGDLPARRHWKKVAFLAAPLAGMHSCPPPAAALRAIARLCAAPVAPMLNGSGTMHCCNLQCKAHSCNLHQRASQWSRRPSLLLPFARATASRWTCSKATVVGARAWSAARRWH